MGATHNDIVKVDLKWSVTGIGFAANIFQAKLLQDTPHVLSTAEIHDDMDDWMERILDPLAPYVVVSCDVITSPVYVKQGALWNLETTILPAFTGTNMTDPLPSGVAALVTAYTYISKVMGKKYVPGLADDAVLAGAWVANVLSALADMAVEWITGFNSLADATSHWWPGVWSLKTISFQSFQSAAAISDIPSYQRRRKEGVGV